MSCETLQSYLNRQSRMSKPPCRADEKFLRDGRRVSARIDVWRREVSKSFDPEREVKPVRNLSPLIPVLPKADATQLRRMGTREDKIPHPPLEKNMGVVRRFAALFSLVTQGGHRDAHGPLPPPSFRKGLSYEEHIAQLKEKRRKYANQWGELHRRFASASDQAEKEAIQKEIDKFTTCSPLENPTLRKFGQRLSPIQHPNIVFAKEIDEIDDEINHWNMSTNDMISLLFKKATYLEYLRRDAEALEVRQIISRLQKTIGK